MELTAQTDENTWLSMWTDYNNYNINFLKTVLDCHWLIGCVSFEGTLPRQLTFPGTHSAPGTLPGKPFTSISVDVTTFLCQSNSHNSHLTEEERQV